MPGIGELRQMKRDVARLCITLAPDNKTFKLKSGRESTYYFDSSNLYVDPVTLLLCAQSMADLAPSDFSFAGVAVRGAIIAAIAAAYAEKPLIVVRPMPKNHGVNPGSLILGNVPTFNPVCILEDTATTGSSIIQTAEILRDQGYTVPLAICLVDRQEGAVEECAKAGINLLQIYMISSLLSLHKAIIKQEAPVS